MTWVSLRTWGNRTLSSERGVQRDGRCRRRIAIQSGKADYVSRGLGSSEVLRNLSEKESAVTESAGSQELDIDGDRDDSTPWEKADNCVERLSDSSADVVVEYGDDDDFMESFGLEEGWSAEIIEEADDFSTETERDVIDLRQDPMFSSLSLKVIQRLETDLKRDRERKKESSSIDESSLSTRTQANPHKKVRIIGGALKGRRLLSPKGRFVRPMMERVRAAIFNMLLANMPGVNTFPSESRWLDLYAGTGAVGLEAMSRGCGGTLFVEMDPWVVQSVLKKNISECDFVDRSTVRTMKVEEFLDKRIKMPQYSSGPFDFISVCPPYQQVSYPDLQKQMEDSGILHDNSVVFMEYPRQLAHQIRDTIGNLEKLKDRQYGRTYLAVYGKKVS